ncbi:uncharacterized protein TNCV_2214001 [Trichonephila clavipes]|nr:uncharacterized protein TNCV_2214001 [Trichonephila clavipes]
MSTKIARGLKQWGVSLQIDHLIGRFAHVLQSPMITYTGMGTNFSLRTYRNATFGVRWIGCTGCVPWPPRFPYLSSLDYFLWGYLKNLVYATPLDSVEDLVARISEAAARVREIPVNFERLRQ